MADDQGIDPKTFNMVAQNAHWEAGMCWIFGGIILFGPGVMWWFLGIGVVVTAWKEFWYDYKYETEIVRGSSLEDFVFYCVGLFGAVALYLIKTQLIPLVFH